MPWTHRRLARAGGYRRSPGSARPRSPSAPPAAAAVAPG
ncbi:hypothetical protein ABZ085_21460 [Streptomyces albidoflavus]